MIAGLVICASLSGQNKRLLGEGIPFVTGIDTPEIGSHAKCIMNGSWR